VSSRKRSRKKSISRKRQTPSERVVCEAALQGAIAALSAHRGCVEVAGPNTGHHCGRLRAYCEALGQVMDLDAAQMAALRRGAVLHDIGKLGIPAAILLKPGALTIEECRVMQQHSVIGERLCRPVKAMEPILPIIRNHHEHWDGSGYPDGLSGERIPLVVRVLQIIDAYDALRSKRPYREAIARDVAVGVLEREAARGKWDPGVMHRAVPLLLQRLPLANAS
jgi:putative two-component system response regulator